MSNTKNSTKILVINAFFVLFIGSISSFLISDLTLNYITAHQEVKLDTYSWQQNMSSFDNWEQLNRDTDFDPDGDGVFYDYNMTIDSSFGSSAWTPEGFSNRTDFWATGTDEYRYAGLYKSETHLLDSGWEVMTQILFDSAYQGTTYSAAGGIRIAVYNENQEIMFNALIADGASSTNSHRIYGHFTYFDQTGVANLVIDTTRQEADVDINNDYLGIKCNGSNNFYVYFPDEILDGNGWRLATSRTNALLRGTPTYLALRWHKRYEAPINLHVTNINFTSSIDTVPISTEGSWEQDMSSLANWTQMNDDPNFDPASSGETFSFDVEVDSSFGSNAWTPEGFSDRTEFWQSGSSDYIHAGLYRMETHLQDSEWEVITRIIFDSAYQGVTYSAAGGIRIAIYNENHELMFYALVADGASSSSIHTMYGHFGYVDQTGVTNLVIDTTRQEADVDINNDYLGIKCNGSNNFYVYFPDEILDGNGWRLATSRTNALLRGSPTYLVLKWHKRYEAPNDLHITNVKFTNDSDDFFIRTTSPETTMSTTTPPSTTTSPNTTTTSESKSNVPSTSSTESSHPPSSATLTKITTGYTLQGFLLFIGILVVYKKKNGFSL